MSRTLEEDFVVYGALEVPYVVGLGMGLETGILGW